MSGRALIYQIACAGFGLLLLFTAEAGSQGQAAASVWLAASVIIGALNCGQHTRTREIVREEIAQANSQLNRRRRL